MSIFKKAVKKLFGDKPDKVQTIKEKASVKSLATKLLKLAFVPKEELRNTEGLSAKNLQAFLEQKSIKDFLLYRSYVENEKGLGIYTMADGRKGIMLRVHPSSFSSASVEDSVFSLVDTLSTEGTVIGFNTFATRNIEYLLENFKETHPCKSNIDNVSVLQEAVNDQYNFMKKGTNESVLKNIDFRVRDFVSIVSVLFVKGTLNREIESTFYQIQANLRKLTPSNFSGTSFLRIVKEYLNPEGNPKDWDVGADFHRELHTQMTSGTSKINTADENGDVKIGNDWRYRTLTTKKFPNSKTIINSFDFYELFFDRYGENLQTPVPCPFLVSLTIVVGNKEKTNEAAANKCRDDITKTSKLGRKTLVAHPELDLRKKEAVRNLNLLEQENQNVYKSMWSITLLENNEARLDKTTKVLKERFLAKNWFLEEEKFGNISLFVLLYGFPLNYHKAVEKFSNRFDVLFTSNNAAIAPLLGNINSTNMIIPYFDRNGQLMPYDNFTGDNYNEAKTGASGAGKSYSQAFAHIMKLAASVKIRVIDNGASYKRFCDAIGGTYIDIGRNPTISMNFFTKAIEAKVIDDSNKETKQPLLVKGTSGDMVTTLHSEAIEGIVPIIGLMVGLDFIASGKKQSASDATEEAFLNSKISQAVIETYIRHNTSGRLEYTRNIIKEYQLDEKEKGNIKHSELLLSVYHGLFDYADPKGPHYIKFNHPNNLDLRKDFVVLETLGLKGKILDIVVVSLAFVVKAEFWSEGVERKKTLDIDEGWMFKDNSTVIKILEDNARTFRKSMSSQGFITQGIQDYATNSSTEALFGSSYHKFLLSQDRKEILKVAKGDFFPLDSQETKTLISVENKKPHFGEAGYFSKAVSGNVFVIKTSPLVHWLCAGADPGGSRIFDATRDKYNLNIIQACRFLVAKEKNEKLSDNDLLRIAKNYDKNSELNQKEENQYWEKEINDAFKENRIQIKAEPINDVETNEIKSYEIYSHIINKDNTISSYMKYVSQLERLGREEDYLMYTIKRAFRYFEDKNISINLNLDTKITSSISAVNQIIELIDVYNFKDKINIELTDTNSSGNLESIKEVINKFKQAGAKIALDNIGLHYHKISYLYYLDIDFIKLEGEVIKEHINNKSEEGLLIGLLKSMSTTDKEIKITVAKHLETQEELNHAKDIGIKYYQGRINKDKTIVY